jgi:predicted O-methyltransferase YrrM
MTKLLISAILQGYADAFTAPEPPVLKKLNRETHLKADQPVMLSGHMQGALLRMISCMVRPKRVLELGTFTGYSAICLAEGLREDGHLDTIDINEELEDMCLEYFDAAGLSDRITMHIGTAASIIPGLEGHFDLVFLDADKQNYHMYYDLVFDRIPVGGYIVADNVLFEGKVMLPENERGKNAMAMHRFNEKVRDDHRVEQVLLPIRDGLLLIRKLSDQ